MKAIQLAHGGGGRLMDELLEAIIFKHLPRPREILDGAILESPGTSIAMTTDSYVVQPVFFTGGDIGKLAVCGTCNDLAMVGATPTAMSLALIIEEGFEIDSLERIIQSAARTARDANVAIVTGDTKVVPRGQADGIFINTTGIGPVFPGARIGFQRIGDGDRILLTGTVGDHGMAVMVSREGLGVQTPIASDVCSVADLANALVRKLGEKIKFLRDPTRGGLAGVLEDIAVGTGRGVRVEEEAIGVSPAVRSAAEVLGIDILHVANEGKFVAVVAEASANDALEICRNHPRGKAATLIGRVEQQSSSPRVVMETTIGGLRIVQKPYGEQLPRIC